MKSRPGIDGQKSVGSGVRRSLLQIVNSKNDQNISPWPPVPFLPNPKHSIVDQLVIYQYLSELLRIVILLD